MSPPQLPAGHVVGRKLVIVAIVVAVLIAFVWFYVAQVQTGELASWYYRFHYDQGDLFNGVFHAWHFPWE
jgi:hypothetical protein